VSFTFSDATFDWPVDPEVEALTPERIDEDIRQFRSLLDSNAPEARVHEFLAEHTYFFNGFVRLYGSSPVYSKVKLGIEHEVDFAFFDSGSSGPEWYFVEIETPTHKLFKKSGDPTAALTHATEQIRDWMAWIHSNLDYARKLMPHVEYPLGYVFMGRRSDLTDLTRSKLRRLVYDNRSFLRIHTFDRLASGAEHAKISRGRGTVPLRALSHADLAQGRPEHVFEWLRDPRQEDDHARWMWLRRNEREIGLRDI
jgi:antiviral defense system Shedu protein SduA